MAGNDIPTTLPDLAHIKQKRARGQLSCTPCRVGKLKCNRNREPACDQCIKRNREDVCQYVPPPVKAKSATNVKGRVRQLESLVKELMTQQVQNRENVTSDQPTPPSDADEAESRRRANIDAHVEQSFGQLDISKEEISYRNDGHWQAILSSLHDIQQDLADDDEPQERNEENHDRSALNKTISDKEIPILHDSILGCVKPRSRQELIQAIPQKNVTDRLLSLWFNSPDPLKVIIHAPTFQEEYKMLWQDQSVSTMWLGLLFAILCQAEAFGLRNGDEGIATEQCLEKVNLYSSLTASSLVLADYTKPKEYTLECLMLYMIGLRNHNVLLDAWLVMGLVVRLALRMGYHRDPDHYPHINAFQAEMRRRVWAMTSMIDILMSFQLGLPSMVRTVTSDTSPPKNLLDRDFGRHGTTRLGREEHELTPSLYVRAKLRLMKVFSEAAENSHSIIPPTLDTILKLDHDLEVARQDIPLSLKMPDISELVTDQAEQLMCRFNLDLLYHKTKIVLFRRYMLVPIAQLSESEKENGIGDGRLACINSARIVLEHHHTIWSAIQPGGQLEHMKWYMGSISTHDFLLAAMVICLELSQQLEKDKFARISTSMQCPQKGGMMRALEQSHAIWSSYSGLTDIENVVLDGAKTSVARSPMSEETEKARKAMGAMLSKLKAQYPVLSENSPAAEAVAEAKAEAEHSAQYFHNMGITPNGAREFRKKEVQKDQYNFHGVVNNYDWGSVPEDFSFSNISSATKSPSSIPSGEQSGYSSSRLGTDPVLMQDLAASQDFAGDAMNLDWHAWDNEIFNLPQDQFMEWNPQASPAAMAQISQTLSDSKQASMDFTNSQPFEPFQPGISLDATDIQGVPLDTSSWTPWFPFIRAEDQPKSKTLS